MKTNKFALPFFAAGLIALMLVSSALAADWNVINTGGTYQLTFTNREGISYNNILVNGNPLLHFQEAVSEIDGNVRIGETFILSRSDQNAFTHILRYDSIDTINRAITFTDFGTGTREVTYDATTFLADLVVGGITYKAKVNNNVLAIDQNGDGLFKGTTTAITTQSGKILTLNDIVNSAQSPNNPVPLEQFDIKATLGENDKNTYQVNGKEYEVEVLVISETSNNGQGSVKLRVNGEITKELSTGQGQTIA